MPTDTMWEEAEDSTVENDYMGDNPEADAYEEVESEPFDILRAYLRDVDRHPRIKSFEEEQRRAFKIETTRRDLERFASTVPKLQQEWFHQIRDASLSEKSISFRMRTSETELVNNTDPKCTDLPEQSLKEECVQARLAPNTKTLKGLFEGINQEDVLIQHLYAKKIEIEEGDTEDINRIRTAQARIKQRRTNIATLLLETPVSCEKRLIPLIKEYIKEHHNTDTQVCETLQRLMQEYQDAKNDLINPNYRLVVDLAKKGQDKRQGGSIMDLIQEGVRGLIRAAEKFEPRRGFTFGTYATWQVRQKIKYWIKKESGPMHIPEHHFHLIHAIDTCGFYEQEGRYPRSTYGDVEKLKELTCLSEDEIYTALWVRRILSPQNLDQELPATKKGEEGGMLKDMIPDRREKSAPQQVIEKEDRDITDKFLEEGVRRNIINTREKIIIKMRFGISLNRKEQFIVRSLIKARNGIKYDEQEKAVIGQLEQNTHGGTPSEKQHKGSLMQKSKYVAQDRTLLINEENRKRYLGTVVIDRTKKEGGPVQLEEADLYNESNNVLENVAVIFSVTKERIRQLETGALKRMILQKDELMKRARKQQ